MSGKKHFLYKLLPPRPSFAFDMTPEEAAIMQAHSAYWQGLLERGTAVAFGPVAEPTGAWGLGLLEVDDPDEVDRVRNGDPAIASGLATAEVHPMLSTIVRPLAD